MDIIESFKGFALLGAQWVMWVLVVLSLFSIAMMIERLLYYFGQRVDIRPLSAELSKLLKDRNYKAARELVAKKKGVAVEMARAALDEAERGPDAADEAAQSAMIQERTKLEKNLSYLGTVGSNAPFIGLFGTVIGIIRAFHDLSLNTQGGAAAVMTGVAEALVATAIGLLVAIPAVIAFNIFQRRIKVLLSDADALNHAILAGLRGNQTLSDTTADGKKGAK
jgi:biopolymer transport protein ExbB